MYVMAARCSEYDYRRTIGGCKSDQTRLRAKLSRRENVEQSARISVCERGDVENYVYMYTTR